MPKNDQISVFPSVLGNINRQKLYAHQYFCSHNEYLPGCVLLPAAPSLLDDLCGALPGGLLVVPAPPHHPVPHPC